VHQSAFLPYAHVVIQENAVVVWKILLTMEPIVFLFVLPIAFPVKLHIHALTAMMATVLMQINVFPYAPAFVQVAHHLIHAIYAS